MLFTRAKAEALLNRTEMGLYDDSRINSLRRLAATDISRRIERGRRARDRARDLVRRQKLGSRDRTGAKRGASGLANERSKQKAELMADILKRFEGALAPAKKREREASQRSALVDRAAMAGKTGKKAAARRTARPAVGKTGAATSALLTSVAATAGKAKPATSAKARTDGPSRTSGVARKTASKKTASKKAAAKKTTRKPADARRTMLTPKRALAKTRRLLEAKQAGDRAAKPWQTLDPDRLHVPEPGYQSSAAARNALALHAAESRMAPIHGSISTRDRRNQGRRDHRGDND